MKTNLDELESLSLDRFLADLSVVPDIRPFDFRHHRLLRNQQSEPVIFAAGKTVDDLADPDDGPVKYVDVVLRIRRQRPVRCPAADTRQPAQGQRSRHPQTEGVLHGFVYDALCRDGVDLVDLKLQILFRQDNGHHRPGQRRHRKTRTASSSERVGLHDGL